MVDALIIKLFAAHTKQIRQCFSLVNEIKKWKEKQEKIPDVSRSPSAQEREKERERERERQEKKICLKFNLVEIFLHHNLNFYIVCHHSNVGVTENFLSKSFWWFEDSRGSSIRQMNFYFNLVTDNKKENSYNCRAFHFRRSLSRLYIAPHIFVPLRTRRQKPQCSAVHILFSYNRI